MKDFIKKHEELLYGALVGALLTILFFASLTTNAQEPKLVDKCIIVEKKENTQPVKTDYSIKVDGKTYPIYRGPKGGLYFIKDGKKVYLTKKQKALIR